MYISNAASRLAGAILEDIRHWRERENFLLLTMYLQRRYRTAREVVLKTAQTVSDRRVCEVIPWLYRNTGCKALKNIEM